VTDCDITALRKHDLVISPNGNIWVVMEKFEDEDPPNFMRSVLLLSTVTGITMNLGQGGIDALEMRKLQC
jgi:hypothetical protein